MGRTKKAFPSYLHHKQTNQARMKVNGRYVYLGKHGSPESKKEYDRICAELASGSLLAGVDRKSLSARTVGEVVDAFWVHAEGHYRDGDGGLTSEIKCLQYALVDAVEIYGHTAAVDFGPLALKTLRNLWVGKGHCRTTVNARANRVRRVFKWAASEELVPVAVYTALATVEGLGKNRSKAREPEPVTPSFDLHVAATLPELNPVVRAMVVVQRLTGCRPQDVVRMRADEIDRSGSTWVYEPHKHKTAYRGDRRRVWIGKPAQEVLAPFIAVAGGGYLFRPAEAKRLRYAKLRAARKSKVQPSQRDRSTGKESPAYYSTVCYAKHVRDAAKRAGVPHWHPNQLRHAFATEVRALYGLEAAQVLLGHTKANVTQTYAERNNALGFKVTEKMG